MKILKLNFSVLSIMLILFIFFGGISFLLSQEQKGNIEGAVTDEDGNPLPGVTVTLSGAMTAPLTSITSAEGIYRFLSLPPARDYILRAELGSFKTEERTGIIIVVGANVEINITMSMGAIEEEVTIVPVRPVLDQEKIENQWVTESYVIAVASGLSESDEKIKADIENLKKSIEKIHSILDQLIIEINALKKLFEDHQKEHKDLDKRLKDL